MNDTVIKSKDIIEIKQTLAELSREIFNQASTRQDYQDFEFVYDLIIKVQNIINQY